MATIEFLQKRIEGAQTKLEKLEKKMERIGNRIGNSRCYEDNSYYEGIIDALMAAGIINKEQKQEINNIKKSWWERISANIEKEEN